MRSSQCHGREPPQRRARSEQHMRIAEGLMATMEHAATPERAPKAGQRTQAREGKEETSNKHSTASRGLNGALVRCNPCFAGQALDEISTPQQLRRRRPQDRRSAAQHPRSLRQRNVS